LKGQTLLNRKVIAAATASLLSAGLLTVLPAASSSASSPPLIMESSPENTITQDFNPFAPTAAPYGMGATGLIYEPLIQFDLAAPPKYYPWLATKFAWSNGGKSITFTIRNGVKWNDGTPFTPQDVVFTFNLVKRNAALNLSGLKISSVTSSGDTVTVNFPTAQYTNLENIAGEAIVPQHVWANVGNPVTFTDPNPVGTGPWMLSTFTSEGFTLKANPDFWQGAPKIQSVYFPVYTSNTGALTALFGGQIDWTGNFIPGLQKNFVNKAPKTRGYWEAPGGTNSLEPNMNKWPTNQLAVRQAISAAVDRTLIADEGEAGLEDPVTSATGLTLPTFAAWNAPVKSLTNSAKAQAAKARSILQKAGYTLKGGFFYKGNQEVTISIVDPSSYTDYADDDALAAQELRAAGINATFDGLTVSSWNQDVASGDFQLTMHWSNGGLTPYNEFDGWLDSSLATGNNATGDYERINNPTINAELAKLAAAPTLAEQTAALAPLAKYVAAQLPIIPMTTASEWFEYNSQHFVGWPSQSNPYETGQPSGTNNGPGSGTDEVVALHLSPR
jgi:peptide/nickel transport system substrate-binding protein